MACSMVVRSGFDSEAKERPRHRDSMTGDERDNPKR